MNNDQKETKTIQKQTKTRAGQPTKYRKKYCKDLIEHMASGRGLNSFSKTLYKRYKRKICPDTFYDWEKLNPEFSYSKRLGQALRESFWEDLGIAGSSGSLRRLESETETEKGEGKDKQKITKRTYRQATFSQQYVAFIMRTQFNYVERVEVTGKDGTPFSFADLAEQAERLAEEEKKQEEMENNKNEATE